MTVRLTQRDIARLARVSQTTVSLVLNNRTSASARIPAETRDRVLKVIRETGYVADPLARRLLQQRNQIVGVFTYESVFPSASADFYHPFLSGIEETAEELGCDLLLFTSAPVTDGRRRVFHDQEHPDRAAGHAELRQRPPAEDQSGREGNQHHGARCGDDGRNRHIAGSADDGGERVEQPERDRAGENDR